jgi:hypothetical protein
MKIYSLKKNGKNYKVIANSVAEAKKKIGIRKEK